MEQIIRSRVEDFIRSGLYLKGWSANTVRTYQQCLALFDQIALTKAGLEQWVISLRERGLTPGGINVRIRSANSFLGWLHAEGHTETRLRLKLLRAPKKQLTMLTPQAVKALLVFKPRTYTERRVLILTLLLLDTGIRIDEALHLERRRIDLDQMLLTVMGKGSKERTVIFSRELRGLLFRWMRKESGSFLFETRTGRPLAYRNVYRDITNVCRRAGIVTEVHPHLMRHTFASTYVKRGGDIYRLSRLLGHTDVKTTQGYLRALG